MANFTRATLMGAAMAAVAAAPALAADYFDPPVVEAPPVYHPKPVSVGGWYIRGHLGMSNQQYRGLYNVLFDTVDNLEFLDRGGFSSAPLFGVGIGYRANRWLRGDLTAEYRGKADFAALDRYEIVDDGNPLTWDGSNDYRAKKSEWLFLANAYVDLGEFHGITPYLGAGAGMSRNTIHHFRDVNVPNLGVAYGATASKWNFAWALHAGLTVKATDNLDIDLGYSFVNLGDARSGDLIAFDGTNNVNNPMHFRKLTSHDFKLGLRYNFGGPKVADIPYEPVVYK